MTTGIEIIRKTIGDDNNALGLTTNLLTKADGTKFGKSEKGAIYLDKNITSPYQMYQFLVNQNDKDVEKLVLTFTFYSLKEIAEIVKTHNENPMLHYAQKKLAFAIVKDIHGEQEAIKSEEISKKLFSEEITTIDHKDLFDALSGVPTISVKDEINVIDLLVALKICNSKSNARTLISSKSISVNSKVIEDFNFKVSKNDA
ncbi:MAG: tyrosine--tRNA ligase, partial [Mycoplasmoidaceae bacterium]|nr:tyrosine--tRNA ligase [Mycoplasmoidaceae bacterium]